MSLMERLAFHEQIAHGALARGPRPYLRRLPYLRCRRLSCSPTRESSGGWCAVCRAPEAPPSGCRLSMRPRPAATTHSAGDCSMAAKSCYGVCPRQPAMSWSSSVAAPARTWSGSAAGSRRCAGSLWSISARRFSSRHERAPARLRQRGGRRSGHHPLSASGAGGLRISLLRAHHGGGLAGHHRQRRGNGAAGRDVGRGGLLCIICAAGRRR